MSVKLSFTLRTEAFNLETMSQFITEARKRFPNEFEGILQSQWYQESSALKSRETCQAYISFLSHSRFEVPDFMEFIIQKMDTTIIQKAVYDSGKRYEPCMVLRTRKNFFDHVLCITESRIVWAEGNENHSRDLSQDSLWAKLDQVAATIVASYSPKSTTARINNVFAKEGLIHMGDVVQKQLPKGKWKRVPNLGETSASLIE